jgi:hypothetical protein
MWERRYSSYSLFNLALDGVSGQRHAPAALFPQERTTGTHWIGGWVGLRAGLDTEVNEKSFASAGDQTSVAQTVVRHYTDLATAALLEFRTTVKVAEII